MSKPTANTPAQFKVRLMKPHRHAGQPHAAGDSITVTAPEREFLIRAGVVAQPDAEGSAPAAQQ